MGGGEEQCAFVARDQPRAEGRRGGLRWDKWAGPNCSNMA